MSKNRLWYSQPASEWNEALPVGNGKLGGMVFGNVKDEHIQLNEDSVWYGGPRNRNNPDALENLPKVRELLFSGRLREAEELADLALTGVPLRQRHYQPLVDLYLTFDHDISKTTHYKRELDLEKGIVKVSYEYHGIHFKREVLASFPDESLVIHLSASEPGAIAVKARLDRGDKARALDESLALSNDSLVMRGGTGGEDGISFRSV